MTLSGHSLDYGNRFKSRRIRQCHGEYLFPPASSLDTVTANIAAAMTGKGTETIEVNGAKR